MALWVLGLLAVAAGAPYLAVTTAGPLLQRWFSTTCDPDALDPYFLYATGNVGSMVGLLAYPTVIEPFLPLLAQARVAPGGILAFHLSNRHLDLEPVLGAVAGTLGMSGTTIRTPGGSTLAYTASEWVVLADDPAALEGIASAAFSSPLNTRPGLRAWTDDFSNILRVVRWW